MALHEQSVGASGDWRTPAYVFEALGCEFDVDVASPGAERTPWIPARFFIVHDSLNVEWRGFAWMNPPFGGRGELAPWLKKFFEHGDGIALVPDRTSAPWWQCYAPRADLILFTAPKIKFLDVNGTPGKSPAQGTCLLAIGEHGCTALERDAERGLGVLMRPELSRLTAPEQRDFFQATA
jgi:DNA N-6-adenine-methyltransferase (Dam)